jgi:hypothetical protein
MHVLTRKQICEANQGSCAAACFRVYDKIKCKEKQAAAKQTFVFHACFNEKADLRSKSGKLRSSVLSSLLRNSE